MGTQAHLLDCPQCGLMSLYRPGQIPAPWMCRNCGFIEVEPKPVLITLPIVEE